MAMQRWNQTLQVWEPYESQYPTTIDSRLKSLEDNQAQQWNFVKNPSFESWIDANNPSNYSTFWNQGAANHSFGRTSLQQRTGDYAFSVTFTAASVSGDFRRLQTDAQPVMPGQWWEASVWVRASVANRAFVTLTGQYGINSGIDYFEPNTVQFDYATATVASTTGWVQLVGRIQVPPGKTVMRTIVSVQQNVAAGTANTISVDDLSVRLVDMSPAISDLVAAYGTSIKLPQGSTPGGYGKIWSGSGSSAGRSFIQITGKDGDAGSAYINVFGGEDASQPGRIELNAAGGGVELTLTNGQINILGDLQYGAIAGSPRSLPRGLMDSVSLVVAPAAITATAVADIPGMTMPSITLEAGRLYRFRAVLNWSASVTTIRLGLSVREATTTIFAWGFSTAVTTAVTAVGEGILAVGGAATYPSASAGAHIYKLGWYLATGAGTITPSTSAAAPIQLSVEDIGAV